MYKDPGITALLPCMFSLIRGLFLFYLLLISFLLERKVKMKFLPFLFFPLLLALKL
jgi:hypothetical protein